MKARTLALGALVLTVVAVTVTIVARSRGHADIEAREVIDPYLRRVQAHEMGLALGYWSGSETPSEDRLRDDWNARVRERGSLDRWNVTASTPGGDVFSGERWVDARVWLFFTGEPGARVPIEVRIAEVDGRPKIVRSRGKPDEVGADDATRVW